MTVVGLAQITGEIGAAESNRRQCEAAVRKVAAEGADVVVLPELIIPGYTLDPGVLARTQEPVDGPTAQAWQRLAAELDVIIVGGFCEIGPDRPYNAVVAVDAGGVVLHYRKLHLFRSEKAVFTPGDLGLPVADTAAGRLGVCVCYDLRFVEVVRVLALRGVELVCVPSAWVAGFDPPGGSRTHGCTQSDGAQLQANLSQVFMACASQSGEAGGTRFLGSSLLIDPTGIARVGPRSHTEEWVGTASVDLEDVALALDRGGGITPRADRRTDVYRLAYDDQSF